ncbi:DUF805 domain-containing protein [Roseicyclus marinus]|uniref:DUF805 domain-containing protein n=1 Tax=Roseicyclus marinus TaxID=2161673 RepID=UPI00240ED69D|nr:DUF805 domain-containing protein [Roseicyclus marinus]MDG3041108.1 DUF805 domain-containing protein [Roseicyclus marinus]
MGPFKAIATCYAKSLTFSGRARRSEYWWFALFLLLAGMAIHVGATAWALHDPALVAAFQDPARIEIWAKRQDNLWLMLIGGLVAYLLLFCLPQLSVTVRRLHDTNRSGWFIFMPTLVGLGSIIATVVIAMGGGAGATPLILLILSAPILAYLWFFVVLCLPGTHGSNRFGTDPIKGRRRRAPDHPAFAMPATPEERASFEAARRAEIQDYYRKNVLANVTRA